MKQTIIKRGDIFWVDFDLSRATKVKKIRPSLVCSHNTLNDNFSRIIVAPITSNLKRVYSFEYSIKDHLAVKGKIMLDQMRTIDKSRLGNKIGSVSLKEMHEINEIIKFVLGVQ